MKFNMMTFAQYFSESRQIPRRWEISNVYLNGDRVSSSKPIPSPSADGALAKFIWLMLSDHERVTRDTISAYYKKAKEIGGYKIVDVGMDAPREHPEPQNNFTHYPRTKDIGLSHKQMRQLDIQF